MGWGKKATPRTTVDVMQSTHGQTFVTWPAHVASSDLPPLPVGNSHQRSRQWVLADRTAVLVLPGDPNQHEGGVVRHVYEVVEASWNSKSKTLASLVKHPDDPDANFVITTSGVGCACTQGAAGNAGPIGEPYQINMANPNSSEFDWFRLVSP